MLLSNAKIKLRLGFVAVVVAAIAFLYSQASDLYIHSDTGRAAAVYPGILVGRSVSDDGTTYRYKACGKAATIAYELEGKAMSYSIQLRDTETYGMIP